MVQAPVEVDISSVGRKFKSLGHKFCVLCNYVLNYTCRYEKFSIYIFKVCTMVLKYYS